MNGTVTAVGVERPVEVVAPPRDEPRGAEGVVRPLVEATKPGITRLVTITSAMGFGLAALQGEGSWGPLVPACVGALVGTALSSAGANTLNQWWERDRDARMRRTMARPLPRGALGPGAVLASGVGLSAAGLVVLAAVCGLVPAAVSLATILIYVLLYTPLKPVTPWATLVGAVPGALPPLIGWTAAAGVRGEGAAAASLGEPLGWLLFAIMFVWQIPHTLAIAWMYKDDYARGGHRVLPVVDVDGRRTARSMVLWSLLLVPVSVAPAWWMDRGPAWAYGLLSGVMALGSLALALRVVKGRERADARRMFFATIIHLPLLLATLVGFMLVSKLG